MRQNLPMRKLTTLLTAFCLFNFGCTQNQKEVEQKAATKGGSQVIIVTSMGNIEVELNPEKAPITVENFLKYVDKGFYNGTIFHRVIKDFMIQGGGFDENLRQKPTDKPIKNEAQNGLKNDKYTIAMARTQVIDSATSQFFINTKDNDFLNFKSPDIRGYGYAVFGKVVAGHDVVDKIAAAPTTFKAGMEDVPVETVKIIEIKRK
jgi:peptidyl-prolyl cis-trans isomerase B (cyclophilin B)